MSRGSAKTVGRVLMAVDASLQNYDALEAAAEFAAHLQAHLEALFVEDINLFKLAELPFAKELDRSSGIMRPLDPDSVNRKLRADAQRFERRLSEESVKRRISVSMRVVRGHFAVAALEIAGKGDVVFEQNVASLSRTSRLPRAGALRQPIWVFYDGSKTTERALALALDLCQKSGCDTKVVVPAKWGKKKLYSRLISQLKSVAAGRYQVLSLADSAQLTGVAELSGGSVLVLPRVDGQNAEEADLLARKLGCPRILV